MALCARFEHRIGCARQVLEQGEVGEDGECAAAEDQRLAADAVRQTCEGDDEADADDERPGDEHVGGELVDLQNVLDEEQRLEVRRVPDDGLPGDEAEEGDEPDLDVAPLAERLAQR